jgi:hypothetical protein
MWQMPFDEVMPPSTAIRQLLLACCFGEDDFEDSLPGVSSEDLEEWDLILEEVVDRILWDCDYQSSNDLMDLSPDVARSAAVESGSRDRLQAANDHFVH